MTCTDVLDARIDAAIQTLRALRGMRAGSAPGPAEETPALLDAQRRLMQQIEALAAARAMCHRAPRPRPRRHSPVGTITTDVRGVIVHVDRSLAGLMRRDPQTLVGRSMAAIIALPDRRRFGHHLCELIENPARGEWQTRLRRDGSLVSISVALRIEVIPGSGLLKWCVRDLRDLRRAQSETYARQESVRGATRLLWRLAQESSRLSRRLSPPGLPGCEQSPN
jgi:PAS domain-containing protein